MVKGGAVLRACVLAFKGMGSVGLVAMLSAPASRAAEFDVGVTAGPAFGRTDCIDGLPCDHHGGFAKLSAGVRFDNAWEVGAAYFHAGKFTGRDETTSGVVYGGRFEADAGGLVVGYGWRFAPGWRLVGRVGAAVVRTRFRYDDPYSGSVDKTALQPLAGFGLAYSPTPQLELGLDYDETRFKVHATRGALRMPGATVRWTF